MTDLEHVERELTRMLNQFKQSSRVMDGLVQIQGQFEDLALTYHKLRESVNETNKALETVNRLQLSFDQQIKHIESELETGQRDLRHDVAQVQEDARIARSISKELAQKLEAIRQEIEDRFAAASEEWADQRDAVQIPMEEFEARLMAELKATVNRLNQSGLNSAVQAEKVEKLDTQLRGTRSSLRTVEKQMRVIRTWLFLTVFISLVALCFPLSSLIADFTGISPAAESTDPGQ